MMPAKLFVGNLSFQATEEDLRELFQQSGTVESVRIVTDQFTGRPRGFGFVEMATKEEAAKAVEMLMAGFPVTATSSSTRRGLSPSAARAAAGLAAVVAAPRGCVAWAGGGGVAVLAASRSRTAPDHPGAVWWTQYTRHVKTILAVRGRLRARIAANRRCRGMPGSLEFRSSRIRAAS